MRHSLYGKEYCQRVLGTDVKIGFNPDSFGHAAGLPAVLKGAGYGYYVFMLRPPEEDMDTPLLFWWEGPDGSRVLTSRIWKNYDPGAEFVRKAATAVFPAGLDHGVFLSRRGRSWRRSYQGADTADSRDAEGYVAARTAL